MFLFYNKNQKIATIIVEFLCIGTKLPNEQYYLDDFLNITLQISENLEWHCYFDYNENFTDINYTWLKVGKT